MKTKEIERTYDTNLISIKTVKTKKYAIIDLTCLEDKTLSWKAKAIHTYLISRPDSWTVNKSDLISRSVDGKSSLKTGLEELISKKYVYRINKRSKRKRFLRWGFMVFEKPTDLSDITDLNLDGWNLYCKTPKVEEMEEINRINENKTPEAENQPMVKMEEINRKNGVSPEADFQPPYYIPVLVENTSPISAPSLREGSPIGEELPHSVAEPISEEGKEFVGRIKRRRVPVSSTDTSPAVPAELSYREKISQGVVKNSKLPTEKKYNLSKKRVSEIASQIIEHWEESGLRKIPTYEDKPKQFNDTITLINAVTKGSRPFAQKYFIDEIKKSITRFSLFALDSSFEPSDPALKRGFAKLHLKDFLYNGFAKMRSWFLHFLDREPKRVIPIIEDKYPKSTKRIKKFYTDYVFGGIPQSYTEEEENKFRKAAIRAKEFYDKHKYSLRGIQGFFPDIVDFLCEAVKEHWGEEVSKVSPGCFCSDFAIKKLQAYCQEQGVIEYRGNEYPEIYY